MGDSGLGRKTPPDSMACVLVLVPIFVCFLLLIAHNDIYLFPEKRFVSENGLKLDKALFGVDHYSEMISYSWHCLGHTIGVWHR